MMLYYEITFSARPLSIFEFMLYVMLCKNCSCAPDGVELVNKIGKKKSNIFDHIELSETCQRYSMNIHIHQD